MDSITHKERAASYVVSVAWRSLTRVKDAKVALVAD